MATVVIRLLITTRFHVSKMDADNEVRQRDLISRREKRWSMNSQRLEQIVAELMRPIGDLRRSFDTDLCALLEEYLTEAGLHALEAEIPGSQVVAPNFAELALLLQQSANIYGRKVDLLYQHVLECSESLHTNTENNDTSHAEADPEAEAESPSAATTNRRKRRASVAGWARINLEACEQARREADLKAPPTLPRMYIELEPRVLAPCDVPLLDYAGEPVGLLQDFNVTWRLHGGLLVDELECGEEDTASLALRAIPLSELQAAIAAAAPPSPPPPPASPEPDHHPPCSTPIPTEEPAAPTEPPAEAAETKTEPATPAKQRKRKQEEPTVLQTGAGKLFLTPELRVFLTEQREFSLPGQMVSRVMAMRAARILAVRAQLKEQPDITEFRGFDEVDKSDLMDIGGFLGFTATTESEATDISLCLSRLASAAESDDDGFFEQSTFSGSEGARPELTPPPPTPPLPAPPPPVDYSAQPEWMSWRADVVARAAAGEARGLDVRALGAAVLRALPEGGERGKGPPAAFTTVLDAAAKDDADVSRLFLATLFLANAGNVEVVQPPPLTLNSFSLRLVSRDERLYSAAADSDPAFLTR
ncbi:uncharacterized protein LOC134668084 [Cydia fagiglandana]|uniref:uncharacterized protein LOC134668084 n=1 Tax=Cydia fagiglandana TaxID=1458189 RepID=UPI002FEDE566